MPIRYRIEGVVYRRTSCAQRLRELEGTLAGKPILVIGNGPSLNRTPLEEFAHVTAIGMNKINLLFPRTTWRPSLILCVNDLVVHQNREFFAETEIPVFLSWKSRWLLRRRDRRRVSYFLSRPSPEFSTDIATGVGSSGTVMYPALQFAYYMGADPVVLFGVDHYFSTEGPPNRIVRSRGPDPDHFDPEYFGKGKHWGLPDYDALERGHRLAREAFEADGRRVYDATIGGRLDVYEKVSIARARELTG